ncbi:MAG: SDR family oxidoreductase [Microthrixaceae bacterium]|nr:SDR family oxidoreductase [Microthrixaceae bacterium]MCB1012360.1 SDR family oxidoreductase [Microthrixaceae bacterium]MCO5321690.1 SDR family oxidoreductase [Microthrixaceae bacterium]
MTASDRQVAPPEPPGRGLLDGRKVVITAAAGSGIGGALARRCMLEGATITISDAHERRLGETADALESEFGTRPATFVCDVTDEDSVQALVSGAVDAMGGYDAWMNNAGLGGNGLITELTDEQWQKVLDVTLTGTFRCLRAALPHLYDQGAGAVVNNASVLGWRAQERQGHYAAAKAGVMALTRTAAAEAAEHGVRVNAVSPSLAMHANLAKVTPPGLLAELESAEAFGRAAEPWEVANVMVFLASDLSSYMTGEVLAVSSQHP